MASSTSSAQHSAQRDIAKKAIERWKNDPVLFAREALGITLWRGQAEIANAIVTNKRVAVRSGHKIGKSTVMAVIGLWFVSTRWRARVKITAPTAEQVKGIVWKELRRIYDEAPVPLGGTMNLDPATGFQVADGREITGRTAVKKENMAGTSTPNLLYLVDEASGVSEEIFEALEGNRAGGDPRMILCSNPTQTSGTFYEAFHTKSEFWHRIHISSEEASQYADEFPGLATAEYIEEKRNEWGEDSPLYAVRVRGDFPEQSEQAVVGLASVTAATEGWVERDGTAEDGRLQIGVDVARFGDDETVIQAGRGSYAFRPIAVQGFDNVDVAGAVLMLTRDMRVDESEIPLVKVDGLGNGSGVVDVLRRSEEIEVVDVRVSEVATAKEYVRLRDQLWFGISEWLKDGGSIPPDAKLESELVAPEYTFDAQGRQKVSSKDEIKRKIHRSPDRADALALMVYHPPSIGRVANGGKPAFPPRMDSAAWGEALESTGSMPRHRQPDPHRSPW